jgi:YVTN family beta-propeller protein
VLAEGPMEPGRAVRVIEQVAKALQAAHKIGLVHRGVKPSNIVLDQDDFAYVIDFGFARRAGQTRVTGTGSVIGSWPYIAGAIPGTHTVYVANKADTVSVIDASTRTVADTVPVGGDPFGMAVDTGTQTAYVITGDATVPVIEHR